MLGIGIAATLAVGACSGYDAPDDASERDTSTTAASDALSVTVADDPDFVIGPAERRHRIVYRVVASDGAVETDRFVVDFPFDSRLETARGAPPGGETVSVQIGTIDRLAIGGVDEPATVGRTPGLAPSVIDVAPLLDYALSAGVLELGEQRMVADRRCQVLRSATTLAAAPLLPILDDEYAESCVDADGLLLEEALFIDGEEAFRRTAVEVELDPTVADDAFAVGDPTAPVDQGGGDTTPADPGSAPIGPFLELPAEAVPDGYRLLGRYSVIPPQPDRFSDPTMRDGIIAGVADVYVSADDVIVVYQGGTLGQIEAFPPVEGAEALDVDGLGAGSVVLDARGSEVRVPLDGGRFVHVLGPVDPDLLVEVAGSLVETEGSGLVLLED